jgi:hypothetical protein
MRSPTLLRHVRVFCFLGTFAVTLSGCHQSLLPKEYVAWIQDPGNGLHVKQASGDFIFDIQYKPYDLLTLERDATPSTKQGDQPSIQYYTMKIACADASVDIVKYKVSSQAAYQQRLYYFSYLFQNDITLEENGTRYPCVLFHFENTDLSGNRVFTLGFDTAGKTSEESMIVIESEKFGSLPVKIEIEKDNIPTLKI